MTSAPQPPTPSNDNQRQPWQDDCLAIAEAMAAQGAREVARAPKKAAPDTRQDRP